MEVISKDVWKVVLPIKGLRVGKVIGTNKMMAKNIRKHLREKNSIWIAYTIPKKIVCWKTIISIIITAKIQKKDFCHYNAK